MEHVSLRMLWPSHTQDEGMYPWGCCGWVTPKMGHVPLRMLWLHMRVRFTLGAWPYETEMSTHMTLLSDITITDFMISFLSVRSFILCTHTYPFLCILRVLVWSDYCILWVSPDDWMAWWYLIQATVLISISCMQKTQCILFFCWHWFQLIYFLWLLIIIIIQSCFMLVGIDSYLYICLLLALFFTLYVHSLTEYFIILTSLCFVWFISWRHR